MIANEYERALVVAGADYLRHGIETSSMNDLILNSYVDILGSWNARCADAISYLVEPEGLVNGRTLETATPGQSFNSGQYIGLHVARHMLPKRIYDTIRLVPVSDTLAVGGQLDSEKFSRIRAEITALALQGYEEAEAYHPVLDDLYKFDSTDKDKLALVKQGLGLALYRGRAACRQEGSGRSVEVDWDSALRRLPDLD